MSKLATVYIVVNYCDTILSMSNLIIITIRDGKTEVHNAPNAIVIDFDMLNEEINPEKYFFGNSDILRCYQAASKEIQLDINQAVLSALSANSFTEYAQNVASANLTCSLYDFIAYLYAREISNLFPYE